MGIGRFPAAKSVTAAFRQTAARYAATQRRRDEVALPRNGVPRYNCLSGSLFATVR